MQRDTKLRISWLIVVQHFFRSLLSIQDGFDKAKKPFQATVPLTRFLTQMSFLHNLFQVRETVSKVSIVTFLNRILARFYFARKIKKRSYSKDVLSEVLGGRMGAGLRAEIITIFSNYAL